jgi:ferric-dicitrate binding protein FerR (iron transport regulator)
VKTSRYDVKVLGTRFNLSAYSHTHVFETSLFEGSVEILKQGEAKGMLIAPNEKAFVTNNELIKGTITNMEQFLWKEGIISFNNESFNEMAKKLELYFDLKIEIHNLNILQYRCTGKFRTKDGVEHILKVLQLSNKFNYTINDKRNTILIE